MVVGFRLQPVACNLVVMNEVREDPALGGAGGAGSAGGDRKSYYDRLPFADGEFDVALCYDVIEHLFSPGRLVGLARVCSP